MRILVVDAQAVFREGCRHVVREHYPDATVVGSGTFDDALAKLKEAGEIDVVLLDGELPEAAPPAGIERLRAAAPDVRIAYLCGRESADDARRALSAGADGYIPRGISGDVMVQALALIRSGGKYVPPEVFVGEEKARRGGFAEPPARYGAGGTAGGLTARQREVLRHLAMGKTNREVADDLALAEGTVKVHVAAIFKALGVKNRAQAVIAAARLDLAPL